MKNWAFLITANLFVSFTSSAETTIFLAESSSLDSFLKFNDIFAV